MRARDVLKILKISRPTLCKYVQEGLIRVNKLSNGRYIYDEKSIYEYLHKEFDRKIVIYSRVSTLKQKNDLLNQEELLKKWCFNKGYKLSAVYSDIASGISFEKRKAFFEMLDEIIEGKIEKIVITYKDRLSRIGFELFKTFFNKFNCDIEVISEVGSTKLDSEEIFEEIVSLLHCYSMKLYSKRKDKTIKDLINND